MTEFISTIEARTILKCSTHFIRKHLETGELRGTFETPRGGTRKMWKIERASFDLFAERHRNNPRVGKRESKRTRVSYRNRGYVYHHRPGHPRANCDGYVAEHVLVMEEKVGRNLTPDEVVHHINRDRGDNRIENLELFATHEEHMRVGHGESARASMKRIRQPKRRKELLVLLEKIARLEAQLARHEAEAGERERRAFAAGWECRAQTRKSCWVGLNDYLASQKKKTEEDDDPPCTCPATCQLGCKGECGCERCHLAYGDFLSWE